MQAVNDLPKFNRRAAAKSRVETNAAIVAALGREFLWHQAIASQATQTCLVALLCAENFFFLETITQFRRVVFQLVARGQTWEGLVRYVYRASATANSFSSALLTVRKSSSN